MALHQVQYRWYLDDGLVNVATPAGAVNTALRTLEGELVRLRIEIETDSGVTRRFFLQHRVNGGTWVLTTLSTLPRIEGSDWVTDGEGTSGGGEVIETARNSASFAISDTDSVVLEWVLRFSQLTVGDLIEFRVLETTSATFGAGGTALGSYDYYATARVIAPARGGDTDMSGMNSSVLQDVRLGLESVPGTAVAVSRRLQNTNMQLEPEVIRNEVRHSAQRFLRGHQKGKSMSKGTFDGALSFHDAIYHLSGLFSKNAPQVYILTTTNTSSNFTLSFKGQTTGNIAGNATASTIQTALVGLSTIGTAKAVVSGSAGTYRIVLVGDKAFAPEAMTGSGSGFTSIARSNGWAPASLGIWTITQDGNGTHSYTLTFGGVASGSIAGNASAATIQAALEAVSTIGTGNVTVVQTSANNFTVSLVEALAGDLRPMTGTGTGLSSGPTVPTITNLRRWRFVPLIRKAEDPQTFSYEKGDAICSSASFLCFQSMKWTTDDKKAEVSGNIFARTLDDGATATESGITDVASRSVDPDNISLFLGTSIEGMVRLTKPLTSEIDFGETKRPKMTQNRAVNSFAGYVEQPYPIKAMVDYEHDSTALSIIDNLNDGDRLYVAWEVCGATLDSVYLERIRATFACEVTVDNRGDKDSVWGDSFTFSVVQDDTLGGAIVIDIDTTLTAL